MSNLMSSDQNMMLPVTIFIGEPWDFTSESGDNVLNGIIIAAANESSKPWLLCNVSRFEFEGVEIKQVIAVNRYGSTQNFMYSLNSKDGAVANFIFDKGGGLVEPSTVCTLLNSSNTSFLIGRIKTVS